MRERDRENTRLCFNIFFWESNLKMNRIVVDVKSTSCMFTLVISRHKSTSAKCIFIQSFYISKKHKFRKYFLLMWIDNWGLTHLLMMMRMMITTLLGCLPTRNKEKKRSIWNDNDDNNNDKPDYLYPRWPTFYFGLHSILQRSHHHKSMLYASSCITHSMIGWFKQSSVSTLQKHVCLLLFPYVISHFLLFHQNWLFVYTHMCRP